jgi:predicted RNase H-like HicB family nuclease
VEEETDGRFIAEVPELPGVMAYGQSRNEAIVKVEALALRVLADRVENGEPVPGFPQIFSAAWQNGQPSAPVAYLRPCSEQDGASHGNANRIAFW